MIKRLLVLLLVTLAACGGGGGDAPRVDDPLPTTCEALMKANPKIVMCEDFETPAKKGTYANPHEECTYPTIQDYWNSGKWCKIIWTEKDWDGNHKLIKHINLSYVGSGDGECGPDSDKVCRAYTGNNVMEDGASTDVVERGEDEDDD